MIRAESLHKSFGSVVAVERVDLVAGDGVVTGILGPNGAGKTTTMRMLTGLIPPDRGTVDVDGLDTRLATEQVRARIGVLSHAHGLYPRLTAREHVAYFGRLHGRTDTQIAARTDELATQLEMREFLDRRTDGFSQGQRLKVALACALVHDPQNVLLDEPTAGLDVTGTRALRALVEHLRGLGRCVLFSSHVMQEVAAVCDRVIIIGAGRVLVAGTLEDVRAAAGCDDLEEAFVRIVGQAAAPGKSV